MTDETSQTEEDSALPSENALNDGKSQSTQTQGNTERLLFLAAHTPDENEERRKAAAIAASTTFALLPDVFALLQLPTRIHQVPDFIWQSSFFTLSRSASEISIVCEERLVVTNIDRYGLGDIARIDNNWRMLRLGVMDLSLVGIAARFSGILAAENIPINIISTFNTDYLMIKQAHLTKALNALRAQGFSIVRDE
jgi:hypothetical protein